ncbi:MAG TPA: methyltransferase domain-containing protein [Candidatus Competibacter sp.]|nr:methyltransferase domain-containing protein [Candidatus Competibacter sp.]
MQLGTLFSKFKKKNTHQADGSQPYIYQPTMPGLTYNEAVNSLAKKGYPIRLGPVEDLADDFLDQLSTEISKHGIRIQDYFIDINAYNQYVTKAGYLDKYKDYYWDNRAEKTLEHFLAFSQLRLTKEDIFIDIASEHSPVPDIYRALSGANCYAQDIQYPSGVIGNKIGGDACAMPVPSEFATSVTLTCSLEHFEGNTDTQLLAEISRILKPNGKLIIAPLYMAATESVQTDPLYSVAADVKFDEHCTVYCKEGWGNRHGRFYSVKSLIQRLINPCKELDFQIFRLRNYPDLPHGIYLRLFMICIKK